MDTALHHAVLKTLSYFSVFQYPLKKEEIYLFLSQKSNEKILDAAIDELVQKECIYKIRDYYYPHNSPELIDRRIEGNRVGKIKLKKAQAIGRFLGMFPFVETVCISGSLSKDFALPDSDLDFFIITSANRLWTARNFMHLFRKITFLFNAQNRFCMNYYVSSYDPEIYPKNLFTAVEMATLKPVWAFGGLDKFYATNEHWVYNHLPNVRLHSNTKKATKNFATHSVEWLINIMGGDMIESLFYRSTMKRWAKKWKKKGYDVAKCMLSAGRHFNTPQNYPVHVPDTILQKHTQIYREALTRYAHAMLAEIPHIHS